MINNHQVLQNRRENNLGVANPIVRLRSINPLVPPHLNHHGRVPEKGLCVVVSETLNRILDVLMGKESSK